MQVYSFLLEGQHCGVQDHMTVHAAPQFWKLSLV